MKKIFALACAVMTVFATSCSKDDNGGGNGGNVVGETKQASVDASVSRTWQYFSFAEGKIVGSGTDADNAEWFAKTTWDMAISRYNLRFNGGSAYTSGGQGGVYTCDENVAFSSITSIPDGAVFATDETITSEGMGGTTTTVKSKAEVIKFKTDSEGNKVMPPVYLKAPCYIVRTANGSYYKVEFTQYKDANNKSGMVEFNYAKLGE